MKTIAQILILFSGSLIFTSCQDVIELDLDQVTPRLVVNANISDQLGPYTVELTETKNFYDDNIFPARTGADVIIFDEMGNRDTLTEVTPGIYITSTIQGKRGKAYTLEIKSEGEIYTATSRIPDQVNPLDTLLIDFEEESIFQDEGYYVTVTTQDPAGVENYYRIKVFVNGQVYVFNKDSNGDEEEDDNLYLYSDKFSDGQYLDFGMPQTLEIGDSVKIEFYHINKASFDYYRTLLDATGSGGVAPSNPISNFGNKALGNFNAYSFEVGYTQVNQ